MSKKFELKMNNKGLEELLNSDAVMGIVQAEADRLKESCEDDTGEPFDTRETSFKSKYGITRKAVNVFPTTAKGRKKNMDDNVMLRHLNE